MKRFIIIYTLLMATLFSSCGNDFLEPEPTGAISESTFYSNESELITGLINMYDGIQGTNALEDSSSELLQGIQFEFYLTEMRSDNTRTKSSEGEAAQFENYSISTSNGIVTDYYQSFYQIIYRANVVLKNIGVATPANAAKIEAEARFVRAYAYFNLVRLFGDVPLINEVIAPLDLEKQFTRVATSTIYDSIIDDLVFASTHLDNTYKNRASKAAAQSLLAKVYLTTKNYSAAQVLCEAVINSGFTLQNNFNDVFYKEGNSEIIFAIGYTNSPASESQGFSAEWLNSIGRSSGVNYVTPEAAAALDELGGNRAAFSYRMDPAQPTQRQVAKYFPNGENGGPTGVAFDLNPDFAGNDWIVLRFADVLLMHVEAIMAGGASTNATAALTSFQKIRDRAGLTATVTNITKQQLLDERRVELAFENQRLFDLMRFGEAQNVLSAFSTANNYSFTATDLLLPIPQREINLSKGLMSQNPGY